MFFHTMTKAFLVNGDHILFDGTTRGLVKSLVELGHYGVVVAVPDWDASFVLDSTMRLLEIPT